MPCNTSPVHRAFGCSASNRPNTAGADPVVAPVSPSRWKLRCRVRSSGAQPNWVCRIRRIAAAVRCGFSRRSATASSSTSAGVRGVHWRGLGTSASNPPARQPRIQRSMVWRLMRTRRPNGSVCSREANSRTIFPRCLVECAASAASQINW